MTQYGFEFSLHPGADAEYLRLHDPVPEAIIDQLAMAGIRDYSIFVRDGRVFGSYRCTDLDRARAALAHDAAPEWSAEVIALIAHRDSDPEFPMQRIPRAFRFEGAAPPLLGD